MSNATQSIVATDATSKTSALIRAAPSPHTAPTLHGRLALDPSRRLSRYVVIAGRGRSGTNFLLSLLNLSPLTHTRNEPHELMGSALSRLPKPWFVRDAQTMDENWDHAVTRTVYSMGARDHLARGPKEFLRPIPRMLGLYRMVDGPRSRALLSLMLPSLRGEEWLMPRWLGDYEKLSRALPVLKLGPTPGWMVWLLKHRPEARVIHIARHPGGFLNSWRNRWLLLNDRQEVRRRNQIRLRAIAEVFPDWAERFGDIDAMSAEEAELWYWTYTNEVIHNAGRGNPNYTLVIYERLAANAVEIARQLYHFCELPWTREIERQVQAESADSLSISNSWQEKLPREQIELVNRMLAQSTINEWWR